MQEEVGVMLPQVWGAPVVASKPRKPGQAWRRGRDRPPPWPLAAEAWDKGG